MTVWESYLIREANLTPGTDSYLIVRHLMMSHTLNNQYMLNESRISIKPTTSNNDHRTSSLSLWS